MSRDEAFHLRRLGLRGKGRIASPAATILRGALEGRTRPSPLSNEKPPGFGRISHVLPDREGGVVLVGTAGFD